ncbi:hypothetical protein WJX81_000700 [Elliptochloris bilobata]|uniref:Uncharacterized protein n=1 Tax=Elliptochloris bilobata TaxID=381761 RepID=A0AAW1R1V6_9CHLO
MVTSASPLPRALLAHEPLRTSADLKLAATLGHVEYVTTSAHFVQAHACFANLAESANSLEFVPALAWRRLHGAVRDGKRALREEHAGQPAQLMQRYLQGVLLNALGERGELLDAAFKQWNAAFTRFHEGASLSGQATPASAGACSSWRQELEERKKLHAEHRRLHDREWAKLLALHALNSADILLHFKELAGLRFVKGHPSVKRLRGLVIGSSSPCARDAGPGDGLNPNSDESAAFARSAFGSAVDSPRRSGFFEPDQAAQPLSSNGPRS